MTDRADRRLGGPGSGTPGAYDAFTLLNDARRDLPSVRTHTTAVMKGRL